MLDYERTRVNNLVTVRTIVTVHQTDLRGKVSGTESHDFPELVYAEQGKTTTRLDGEDRVLEAGQMMIYGPNAVHCVAGGVIDVITFETDTPLPESLFNQTLSLTGSQRVRIEDIIHQAIPLFEYRIGVRGMALKSNADLYALQSVKNKLELFLLDMLKPGENYSLSRMNAVTDYMTRNLHRVLTVDTIGAELGISSAALKRLVSSTCGKPPMAYFIQLKIQEAKRLITVTPMNMTQIAEALGFASVHHFSRVFREKTGVTPTEYKKEIAQKKGAV